jgi:hypothetical protein
MFLQIFMIKMKVELHDKEWNVKEVMHSIESTILIVLSVRPSVRRGPVCSFVCLSVSLSRFWNPNRGHVRLFVCLSVCPGVLSVCQSILWQGLYICRGGVRVLEIVTRPVVDQSGYQGWYSPRTVWNLTILWSFFTHLNWGLSFRNCNKAGCGSSRVSRLIFMVIKIIPGYYLCGS